MRKDIIIYILLILTYSFSFTQNNILEKEKTLFQRNIDFYKSGKYETVRKNISLIIERLPKNRFLTAYKLILAKTYYKLGNYEKAVEFVNSFTKQYPQSAYCDDMLYNSGNCYYRLSRYETAIKKWINAIDCSEDRRLKEKLSELVRLTSIHKLEKSELHNLEKSIHSGEGKMLIQISKAECSLRDGDFVTANNILKQALAKYPDSQFKSTAKSILTMTNGIRSNIIRFALLLPLSSTNEELANQIKEGVEYAVSEFNNTKKVSIELVIKDYGDDIFDALNIVKELAQDKSIIAVLGPVENDISVACATVSEYERLPLISPTATRDGLTDLSSHFFQLNCPISIHANKLAKYALDSLNILRYATISPMDDKHFVRMVDKFTETVKNAGGEVVAQEWYYSGEQDFNKYFMKIKRVGLKYVFKDSVLSVYPNMTQEKIDSLYREYVKANLDEIMETNTSIDSADIEVNSIKGFFIPIYKEDFKLVAPQIAYSNIQSQYLGNCDWYDLDLLNKHKKFINGIIFTNNGFMDENSWDYRKFRNTYRSKLNKTPTIYNLMGYDSMKFMLKALENRDDYISREQYYKNLKKIKKYTGVYYTIEMNGKHFNQNAQLLKYLHGQIIPLN